MTSEERAWRAVRLHRDRPSRHEVPLRDYAGKVLLIVNVESKCALTPQNDSLESLYRDDKDRGLEILGFPCTQFNGQEPGNDEEIQDFCKNTYDVTFPVFSKIEVNGSGPIRSTSTCGSGTRRLRPRVRRLLPGHLADPARRGRQGRIKWNFTKFLVGRDGTVIKRYEPPVPPADIKADLENDL